MRAHMALKYSGVRVELREVDLQNYPPQARKISAKATVPVLHLADGTVIDESWDILKWALAQNDPDHWLGENNEHALDAEILIETNDFSFKEDLDRYKYADRYPEHSEEHYREACEEYIAELEDMLSENSYLLADRLSLADIGVFPFVRQFSLVDKEWFEQAPYPLVRQWLNTLIDMELFTDAFQKHELWQQGVPAVYI
jgi:glutathione S-transferase